MSTDPRLAEIEEYFHWQIPITKAMRVKVAAYDGQELVIEAPLEVNHNHLGTAFGGSLSAIATLAGYGLIWLTLRDRDCHMVIRDSFVSYKRPVRGKIRAVCRLPEAALMDAFKREFAQHGKARIILEVTIEDAGKVAVEFTGTFVALS